MWVFIKLPNQKIERVVQLGFTAPYNKVEYEANIFSLRVAFALGVIETHLFIDSRFMDNQYSGPFEGWDDRLSAYLIVLRKEAKKFHKILFTQRLQDELRHADSLAFLVKTLEINNSRSIQIDIEEKTSIKIPVEELSSMYFNSYMYFRSIKRRVLDGKVQGNDLQSSYKETKETARRDPRKGLPNDYQCSYSTIGQGQHSQKRSGSKIPHNTVAIIIKWLRRERLTSKLESKMCISSSC